MIADVLSFLSRSSRPALAALGVGVVVAYFIPDSALRAIGFSPVVTRLVAIGIQLAALVAVVWPWGERKWLEVRKTRESEKATNEMRQKCLGLTEEARIIFANFVHSADQYIYLPMGSKGVLELEGAGLLKRLETSSEVAKLCTPESARKWLARDFAWAISNLELDSDRRVGFQRFAAGCERRFFRRV